MKNSIIVLTLLVFAMAVTSCEPSAQSVNATKTEQLLKEINSSVGMPAIKNFQEKRWAKSIFELRDQADLTTYAYIITMTGKKVFLGRCVGYGLPYSVQYTAPERLVIRHHHPVTMPQADPNGLYMPEGLSATWLMMEDPNTGQVKPVYIEQEILVSPFKLH